MQRDESKSASILKRLKRGEVLISDGATATYLQTNGLEPGGCPEELNESRPELIRNMAKSYYDAGSDMVLTNSFGGSKFMLKKYGYEDKVEKFNRLAAEHTRSQIPDGHFVVGSVGPTGELLEPLGDVTEQEMLEAFTEQITSLEKGGADAVIIETMFALEEVTLAIKAAKDNTTLPVISTMTFDKGPRGYFTMMGVTPDRAVKEMLNSGADIVGANCGNGIDNMIEIARKMIDAIDAHFIIHSNAGIPSISNNQIVYHETPEYMAERFKILTNLGVSIVGGCCGTTPQHIEALSAVISNVPVNQPEVN